MLPLLAAICVILSLSEVNEDGSWEPEFEELNQKEMKEYLKQISFLVRQQLSHTEKSVKERIENVELFLREQKDEIKRQMEQRINDLEVTERLEDIRDHLKKSLSDTELSMRERYCATEKFVSEKKAELQSTISQHINQIDVSDAVEDISELFRKQRSEAEARMKLRLDTLEKFISEFRAETSRVLRENLEAAEKFLEDNQEAIDQSFTPAALAEETVAVVDRAISDAGSSDSAYSENDSSEGVERLTTTQARNNRRSNILSAARRAARERQEARLKERIDNLLNEG